MTDKKLINNYEAHSKDLVDFWKKNRQKIPTEISPPYHPIRSVQNVGAEPVIGDWVIGVEGAVQKQIVGGKDLWKNLLCKTWWKRLVGKQRKKGRKRKKNISDDNKIIIQILHDPNLKKRTELTRIENANK